MEPPARRRLHPVIPRDETSAPHRNIPLDVCRMVFPAVVLSGIVCGILSPESILTMSVAQITEDKPEKKGMPRPNSVNDTRLGTNDRRYNCGTCHKSTNRCNGHMGHIILPLPVYHPLFLRTLRTIASCFCFHCCRILGVPETDAVLAAAIATGDASARFKKVTALLSKRSRCPWCDIPCFKITIAVNGTGLIRSWTATAEAALRGTPGGSPGSNLWAESGMDFPMTPADLHAALKNVSSEDLECLGIDSNLTRPENMIITVLPVPPPCIRPVICKTEGGSTKGQDPLTHSLNQIIKACQDGNAAIAAHRNVGLAPAEEVRKAMQEPKRRKKKAVEEEEGPDATSIKNKALAKMINAMTDDSGGVASDEYYLTFGDALGMTLTPGLTYYDDMDDMTSLLTDVSGMQGSAVQLSRDLPAVLSSIQGTVHNYFVSNKKKGNRRAHAAGRADAANSTLPDKYGGKTGRFRKNMLGKRVEQSARAVITPDVSYDANVIGVPNWIAVRLTTPMVVTHFNMAEARAIVCRGPGVLGGAKNAIEANGKNHYLEQVQDLEGLSLSIEPGWVIKRHLRDGDPVLANRQPTLHRLSINSHTAKLHPGKTIIINQVATGPYNADFDGDEMNIHSLGHMFNGGFQARAEALCIADFGNNSLAPQNNRPSYGLCLDGILGAGLMTMPDSFITRDRFHDLSLSVHHGPGKPMPGPTVLKAPGLKEPLWTGSQLVGLTLPDDMHWETGKRPESTLPQFDDWTLIRRGELMAGWMNKAAVGARSRSMVHYIAIEYGSSAAMRWLSDVQRVIVKWMVMEGVSMGSDCMIACDEVAAAVRSAQQKIDPIIESALGGIRRARVAGEISTMVADGLENRLTGLLMQRLSMLARIVLNWIESKKGYVSKNMLWAMVNTGSKGSPINVAQMLGGVGQTSLGGGRIVPDAYGMTLPMYARWDPSLRARGMIYGSYGRGLTLSEFFMHAVGGREGLTDTAKKTAVVGYLTRSIQMFMMDIVANYDSTLRINGTVLVQCVYGGCGMDSTRLISVTVPPLGMTAKQTRIDTAGSALSELILHLRLESLRSRSCVGTHFASTSVLLPFDARALASKHAGAGGDRCTAEYILTAVKEVMESPRPRRGATAMLSMAWELRKMEPGSAAAAEECMHLYWSAEVQPGENLGPLAAQSVGEPVAQMTLNTFHYSGVASAGSVTAGLPALTAAMNLTKVKVPAMTVPMRGGIDDARCAKVVSRMKLVCVRDVVGSGGGDVAVPHPLLDVLCPDHGSKPQFRIQLDREKMEAFDVTSLQTALAVSRHCPGCVAVPLGDLEILCIAPPLDSKGRNRLDKRLVKELAEEGEEAEVTQDLIARAQLYELRRTVYKVAIKGVEPFLRAAPVVGSPLRIPIPANDDMDAAFITRHVLIVSGSSFVRLQRMAWADIWRSTSNSIMETFATFGIMAAQMALHREITRIIKASGANLDPRFIALMAARMTMSGTPLPCNRRGIAADPLRTLLQTAAFEQAIPAMVRGATLGTSDTSNNSVHAMILGSRAGHGTGFVNILPADGSGRLIEQAAPSAAPRTKTGIKPDTMVVFT